MLYLFQTLSTAFGNIMDICTDSSHYYLIQKKKKKKSINLIIEKYFDVDFKVKLPLHTFYFFLQQNNLKSLESHLPYLS